MSLDISVFQATASPPAATAADFKPALEESSRSCGNKPVIMVECALQWREFGSGMTKVSSDDDELQAKLIDLQTEHLDLDNAIDALVRSGATSQMQVQRLKKRKLMLKDAITQLQNRLIPDIIA
ncbi:MAG: DUF465 domain-containing protein [Sphingomonadales bacterium]